MESAKPVKPPATAPAAGVPNVAPIKPAQQEPG